MNKNKGFTLMELLAVIVILAILMVISVPKILNIIENSKKSAAESSIKLLKDAIRSQVTSGDMTETNLVSDESGCYTFNFDDQTSGNAKELKLKNKDKITGTIKYCNGNFTNNTLSFNGQDMSHIICKKADETTLHTINGITYGTISNGKLKSGDAFDCDVNGDGVYNSETERFYYVSDYYNTKSKKFETDTAVLIYYNNVSKGKPSSSVTYVYDGSGENFHGPRTAIEELPSTSEWRNVSLKSTSRAILNESGGNTAKGELLPSDFSYAGKSARLLTIQEVRKAAENENIPTLNIGELDDCKFLLENTKYSSDNINNAGYWLETIITDSLNYAWHVYYGRRSINDNPVWNSLGVRPAIEVSKYNIYY